MGRGPAVQWSPGAVSLGSCSGSLRMGTCYSELNESQGMSGGQEIEEVAEGRDWWAWD